MAEYYIAPKTSFDATADAIREKTGSQATIEWTQNGFADAVNAIPTGEETEPPMLDVDFIDYDGTLLYSYSATDFLAMNAFPANPSHEGLTAQGWNWSLADAKAYVQAYGMLVIGQNYATTDGKTKYYITLNASNHVLSRAIRIRFHAPSAVSGSVDWGDGDTTSFTDQSGSKYFDHTYSAYGDYIIAITTNGSFYLGYNGSNSASISYGTGSNMDGGCECCTKVELSQYVVGFCRMAFQNCTAMKSISIPTSATGCMTGGSGDILFGRCYSLTGLVFPDGVETFPLGCGSYMQSLKGISFPKTITVFPGLGSDNQKLRKITAPPVTTINSIAYFCALEQFVLPGTYTTIGSDVFRCLVALQKFTIPASVTTMSGSAALGYPFRMRELHCLPTSPPPINNTVIRYLPSDAVIYVPYSEDHSILEAYQTATNWSVGASKMIEEVTP